MSAALSGFSLGFSLILAIGAQNAFVLRQGLRREHVLLVCLICAVSDALLIGAGVGGFAQLSDFAPWITPFMRYGGVAFLLVYGVISFRNAWRSEALIPSSSKAPGSRRAVVATCLALTWLNPHVYLDTVVLLGSVAAQYPGAQLQFGLGAVISSFTFFFALGYGARALAPIFLRPRAWQVLDVFVGLVMWSIALSLIFGR